MSDSEDLPRVGFWQVVAFPRFLDRESSRSITSLKIFESVDGDSRSSGGELQKARFLLAVPASDCLPEELDHLIGLGVSSIVSVLLPILDIDFCDTTNQQLQLSLVKDINEFGGNELVESSDESLELIVDTLPDSPVDHEFDVLLFVFVCDLDVSSTRFEVLHLCLSKSLIFRGEGLFQHTLNRVVKHPLKTAVEIGVHTLHVWERDGLVEHHFVQGTNEECIEKTTVENGKTDDTADEFEVVQMFWVDTGVRVDLESVVVVGGVFEQAVEGVEHLMGQEEEELSGESTVVQAIFSIKLDHESLLQVRSRLAHDLGIRILENMRSSNFDVALARKNTQCRLRSEVDEFPSEVTLVLRNILIER